MGLGEHVLALLSAGEYVGGDGDGEAPLGGVFEALSVCSAAVRRAARAEVARSRAVRVPLAPPMRASTIERSSLRSRGP